MIRKTFSSKKAGYEIQAEVTLINEDTLVILTGGDVPHLGTVTFQNSAKPQLIFATDSSTKKPTTQNSASLKTLRFASHSGRFHKEDVLAEAFLKETSFLRSGNWVVTSGVHINGITPEQIEASYEMAKELGKKTAEWLRNVRIPTEKPEYLSKL